MVDLVDSIGRKLERNDNNSQGSCLQIAGTFQIAGAPQIAWAPRIAGAPQIGEAPQTVERGPSRMLRAHHIAMRPQTAGEP